MSYQDNRLPALGDMLKKSYYQLLEVEPSASLAEIQAAYQRMKSIYQPGSLAAYSLFSSEDLASVVKRLDEAYLVLTDLKKRREYDSSLIKMQQLSIKDLIDYKQLKKEIWAANMKAVKGQKAEALTPEHGMVYDGKSLKKLRQLKKISLDQISKITKISSKFLIAIENMDSSMLPARIYLKGFLKEYAKCLKLDPEEVSRSYLEAYDKIKDSEKKIKS